MIRTAIITTAAALNASGALACTMPVPSCATPGGGEAYLDGHVGSVVVFSEHSRNANSDQVRDFVVVECQSRNALSIRQPAEDDGAFWQAEGIMYDAVHDDQPQTLSALARQIERLGIETTLGQLPANHCGCELPNMPDPPFDCPADF